jgi:hypothetical protein
MIEVARSRTGATTDVRLPGVQVAKKEPVYGCLGVHCDGTAAGVAKARNMDHKTKYTRRQEAQFDHGTIWQMDVTVCRCSTPCKASTIAIPSGGTVALPQASCNCTWICLTSPTTASPPLTATARTAGPAITAGAVVVPTRLHRGSRGRQRATRKSTVSQAIVGASQPSVPPDSTCRTCPTDRAIGRSISN